MMLVAQAPHGAVDLDVLTLTRARDKGGLAALTQYGLARIAPTVFFSRELAEGWARVNSHPLGAAFAVWISFAGRGIVAAVDGEVVTF